MEAVRVLIADDHDLFAKTLEAVLAGDARIEVAGRAHNGSEAVRMATALAPDVVVMDLQMPVMDGFEATQRLRDLGVPSSVLVLTASDDRGDAARAIAAGAAAFLTKDRVVAELNETIIAVRPRRDGGEAAPAAAS